MKHEPKFKNCTECGTPVPIEIWEELDGLCEECDAEFNDEKYPEESWSRKIMGR